MDADLWMPNKDTTLCMSISARPSNIGTRFHNYLYRDLGLNYLYKAFTTDDLASAIRGVRALGIRGCAISMPFKEQVIPLVDQLAESAAAISSVNTIVNDNGVLMAHNTDYAAVDSLLESHDVDVSLPTALTGSGAMAITVTAALRSRGFTDVTIVARNETKGTELARRYGYRYALTPPGSARLLINVTPIGMAGTQSELPFPAPLVEAATTVFDVVAIPSETALIRHARTAGVPVITGAEVISKQAEEQFVLYTGIRPPPEVVARASWYSLQTP